MNDFKHIALIGLGLMGGSMAMALRERSDYEITGFDCSPSTLEEAKRRGLIDHMAVDPENAVKDADLVILGIPVGSYPTICQEMKDGLKPGAVVTDMGSVKEPAMKAFTILPNHCFFVGGHPLAGSEKGGLGVATPYLFENAYYFLTPGPETPPEIVNQLKTWISTLGAFPVIVSPEIHDVILAKTSHFPHVVASLLATILGEETDKSVTAFTGSGFRDTTRIASGNPEMWEEILYLNRSKLADCLLRLEEKARAVRAALNEEQRQWMLTFLREGKALRDSLPKAGKDYLPAWYEIYVDIKDQPGALAAITGVLARAGVNIREIEIQHAREGDKGAVRLAFTSIEEEHAAMKALSGEGHSFARSKGENNDADNE